MVSLNEEQHLGQINQSRQASNIRNLQKRAVAIVPTWHKPPIHARQCCRMATSKNTSEGDQTFV